MTNNLKSAQEAFKNLPVSEKMTNLQGAREALSLREKNGDHLAQSIAQSVRHELTSAIRTDFGTNVEDFLSKAGLDMEYDYATLTFKVRAMRVENYSTAKKLEGLINDYYNRRLR